MVEGSAAMAQDRDALSRPDPQEQSESGKVQREARAVDPNHGDWMWNLFRSGAKLVRDHFLRAKSLWPAKCSANRRRAAGFQSPKLSRSGDDRNHNHSSAQFSRQERAVHESFFYLVDQVVTQLFLCDKAPAMSPPCAR